MEEIESLFDFLSKEDDFYDVNTVIDEDVDVKDSLLSGNAFEYSEERIAYVKAFERGKICTHLKDRFHVTVVSGSAARFDFGVRCANEFKRELVLWGNLARVCNAEDFDEAFNIIDDHVSKFNDLSKEFSALCEARSLEIDDKWKEFFFIYDRTVSLYRNLVFETRRI